MLLCPHTYMSAYKVMNTSDGAGGPSQCKRRLLVEMEDRLLSIMSSAP